MKQNGYKILCEFLKSELGDNKIPGTPDVLPKRPIDSLTKETIKDAGNKSDEYTAKATKDPDPLKVKVDLPKGQAAGDAKGKVEKELGKIEK